MESLHPFSHWITPEVESRRFDTKFFATRLPVGQDLAGLTDEHQAIGWFRPEQTSGLPMLPPTAAVLAELATFGTVEQALAPQRQPVPIMPRPIPVDDQELGIDWSAGQRLHRAAAVTNFVAMPGSLGPWKGGRFSGGTCVLAGNPGPMTLDGTNTWVLAADADSVVLVDPGPDDRAHLAAVERELASRWVRRFC